MTTMFSSKCYGVPHPFPYQGSKRAISKFVLPYFPGRIPSLIEPFCGSAAISIAAVKMGLAERIVLNDINKPLMDLWRQVITQPHKLADVYEKMWVEQIYDSNSYFMKIRDKFNKEHKPEHLLYLLARIVKASVRYNSCGQFNQSPDNRRLGMRPAKMRENILGVSSLLYGRSVVSSIDYREVVDMADIDDIVYMDPPYQGTSGVRDSRYLYGVDYAEFVDSLEYMNENNISYIVSYDGYTGNNFYGKELPEKLELKHVYVSAGRSSQATLLGKNKVTVESLYISRALVYRLSKMEKKFIPYSADVMRQPQLI